MRTVDAVKGRWAEVFNYYDLPPITGKRHYKGKCPICSKKGKFRIDDHSGNGTYICVCGSGDGWQLLEATQGKGFKELAKEVDSIIGNQYQPTVQPKITKLEHDIDRLHNQVIKKYNSLAALKDTTAASYLANRGIFSLPNDWIRFCGSEKTPHGELQSMYAIATDDNGKACYLHRTFLDGSKKAAIPTPKRMRSLQRDNYLDHSSSVAIRMFPTSSTIGIAEGIETALSCKQIYHCNTWSVINASLMRRFKAPSGVNHLIIFADSDANGTGLRSAFDCGNMNLLSKNDVERVSIRWPKVGDFNDMLLNGEVVHEWVLHRERVAA